MQKNSNFCVLHIPLWRKNLFLTMKQFFFLLAYLSFTAFSAAEAQRISEFSVKDADLKSCIKKVEEISGLGFIYNGVELEKVGGITLQMKNVRVEQLLDKLLDGSGYTYELQNGVIAIIRQKAPSAQQQPRTRTLHGTVSDPGGTPLIGVTVVAKGTTRGVATGADGKYRLVIPDQPNIVLAFSFLGKESKEVKVADKDEINVILEDKAAAIQDVVVTGIYTRSKESFTGSAATYTVTDLKNTGTRNILEGLKTLDPSFAIIEDNEYGSDPNRLPNMEVRGKSSMLGVRDQLEVDPNQPLFILDGFESSVAAILDLDINRVESITILKDAASTAIYGSKAANGVVVVETVKPRAGELRVSYTGSLNISMPDLTSYNLMNSAEKLQFDLLSGRFDGSSVATDLDYMEIYNQKLSAVQSGVDTYWLAEPLRVGVNQKHSLYVEGGEGSLRFGLGGSFNGNSGVMEKSLRQAVSGNIDLIYRVSKFQFSNKFSVGSTRMTNPVVPFQTYAEAIPYYKKRSEGGTVEKWLEYNDYARASNPLWNASLNSRNKGNNLLITDYFVAEYMPSAGWKLRARFGITYGNDGTEVFYSPDDTRYEERENTRKGEFISSDTNTNRFEGELTATWAKVFDLHRINFVAGANIYNSKSLTEGYSVEGFPEGDFSYPSFSNGYPENGTPTYYENISRSINGYLNLGYSFDDRYLLDFSLRSSGSSVFGTSRKYNTTWSVGLGWNIHREKFVIDNLPWLNMLRLRASIGNPGNQSFDSAQTLLTYAFQYGALNQFGLGALLDQVGNADLKWQTTRDMNIGFDLALLDRRLSLTADYYHKLTDPLLININMPESAGTATYLTNAGEQLASGLTVSAVFQIIRNTEKRVMWSVRANLRTQRIRLDKIGNQLAALNSSGRGANTVRYYDGSDPNDIWAIISEGIDPANGKELFRTPTGEYTYDFSYDYEVKCGNTRPDIEGIVGTQLTWRGLSLNLNFRYQLGADVFNTALYNKVENIGSSQRVKNQDRRALYERWHKAGDIARYKDIASSVSTPMSSRFVQREDIFALESVHVSWEFNEGWIERMGLSNARIYFSMRDVFRLSSIRAERGISYPFARGLETGISFNF